MEHEMFMNRCVALAQNGLGTTYPNPLVGAVIVHEGRIIGEGWHRKAGEPHAEVLAIQAVKNPELLRESTIYVSLEPCSHFGKTPPCADLIISSGIPRVVVGSEDPNPLVAGKGIAKLRAAGIEVLQGVGADACEELNQRFFTFHRHKRPYVILKWAQTANGFLAPAQREARNPVWITNPYSRQLVHQWRAQEAAILVGAQTVVDDNPRLDVRLWTGKNPVRIVIDKSNRVSKESHIFDNQAPTIVINASLQLQENTVSWKRIDFEKPVIPQVLEVLYRNGLQSVIVEGGGKTLQAFLDAGLWDEARVFRGTPLFANGTPAPQLPQTAVMREWIMEDELMRFKAL